MNKGNYNFPRIPRIPLNRPGHRSNLRKDYFRGKYFEALDLTIRSIRTRSDSAVYTRSIRARFDQICFIAFSDLESYLIQSVKGQGIADEKIVKYIREIYNEDLDEEKLQVEMNVLRAILADVNIMCFADKYKKMKEIGNIEKSLTLNTVVLCNLLIVNPATSCTPKSSFSTIRRLKTWLRVLIHWAY